jgi:membrane protease YdiL (CAAX protease family)
MAKSQKSGGKGGKDSSSSGPVPYAPRTRTRVAFDVLSVVVGVGAAHTILEVLFAKAALPIIRPVFLGLLRAIAAYAVIWGLLIRPKRYHAADLGLPFSKATLVRVLAGLGGGLLMGGLAVGLAVFSHGIEMHRAPSWQAPQAIEIVLWVAAALLAALFEELVFRSGSVGTLRTAYPRWAALLVPAVIFSLGHLANPHLSPIAMFNTVLAGLWLGLLFLHPKNEPMTPGLGLAVGAHAGWNVALRLLGVPVSGNIAQGRFFQVFSVNDTWGGGAYGVEGGLSATLVFGAATALTLWDIDRRAENATAVR